MSKEWIRSLLLRPC